MDIETIPNNFGEIVKETTKPVLPHENLSPSFYRLCGHWKSSIEFVESELKFFQVLVHKHLGLLIDAKNIEQTRYMVSHIMALSNETAVLRRKVGDHIQHLTALMEYRVLANDRHFNDEHLKLEYDFAEFMERFRTVKGEVFDVTERVIRAEKARKVVDWG